MERLENLSPTFGDKGSLRKRRVDAINFLKNRNIQTAFKLASEHRFEDYEKEDKNFTDSINGPLPQFVASIKRVDEKKKNQAIIATLITKKSTPLRYMYMEAQGISSYAASVGNLVMEIFEKNWNHIPKTVSTIFYKHFDSSVKSSSQRLFSFVPSDSLSSYLIELIENHSFPEHLSEYRPKGIRLIYSNTRAEAERELRKKEEEKKRLESTIQPLINRCNEYLRLLHSLNEKIVLFNKQIKSIENPNLELLETISHTYANLYSQKLHIEKENHLHSLTIKKMVTHIHSNRLETISKRLEMLQDNLHFHSKEKFSSLCKEYRNFYELIQVIKNQIKTIENLAMDLEIDKIDFEGVSLQNMTQKIEDSCESFTSISKRYVEKELKNLTEKDFHSLPNDWLLAEKEMPVRELLDLLNQVLIISSFSFSYNSKESFKVKPYQSDIQSLMNVLSNLLKKSRNGSHSP